MRAALVLLLLLASAAWGQTELTRARAMELWPVYVRTQLNPATLPAVMDRLNMYRAAAGIAPVTLDSRLVPASMDCARVLAMNADWPISHSMPSTLRGWTPGAAEAARNGCIDRNDIGAKSVADMVRDWGLTPENRLVGHRRWLLDPGLQTVGVGGMTQTLVTPASLCIYVVTPQSSAKQIVAWPPSGDVPIAWVPERWSCSIPGADVSRAVVLFDNVLYSSVKSSTTNPSIPDSVVVWQPIIPFNQETMHSVQIAGVTVGGKEVPLVYTVRRFKPPNP